jgi:lysophospholipase L1-like esterase
MDCPRVLGFKDINCDGQFVTLAIGDSVVAGKGDKELSNQGGYVPRLQQLYPDITITRIGLPGMSAKRLYPQIVQTFAKNTANSALIYKADFILIDVGRNDFWEGNDPALTVRNIKRIVAVLRTQVYNKAHFIPAVKIAYLTPTTRSYQYRFIHNVNALLWSKRSYEIPAYVRFDLLDARYISVDGLHPTSNGYIRLRNILRRYLLKLFFKLEPTPTVTPTPAITP